MVAGGGRNTAGAPTVPALRRQPARIPIRSVSNRGSSRGPTRRPNAASEAPHYVEGNASDTYRSPVERLGSANPRVRQQARAALLAQGAAAVPTLQQAFAAQDASVRLSAVELIGAIEPELNRTLVPMFGDPDLRVREAAVGILAQLGPASARQLLDWLGDDDEPVRVGAAFGLSRLKLADDFGLETLVAAVADPHPAVRGGAIIALGRLPTQRQDVVVQSLLLGIKDPHPDVAELACNAVIDVGAPAAEPLLAALEHSRSNERALICAAVGEVFATDTCREHAMQAVHALVSQLADPAVAVRREATTALGKLGCCVDSPATAKLVDALADPDPQVRAAACGALGELARMQRFDQPQRFVDLLQQDVHALPRGAAASALACFRDRPDAGEFVAPLISSLADPDCEVRERAAATLADLGSASTDKLVAAMAHEQIKIGEGALAALSHQGEAAVAPLVEALADSRQRVRILAAAALRDIGPSAAAAIPALERLQSDRDRDIQYYAWSALKSIRQ